MKNFHLLKEKFKIGEQFYLNEFNVEWLGSIIGAKGLGYEVYKFERKEVEFYEKLDVDEIFLLYNCDILSIILTLKRNLLGSGIKEGDIINLHQKVYSKTYTISQNAIIVIGSEVSQKQLTMEILISLNLGQT